MNIKATREEINECLTRAIERVLRENIELVGTDDKTYEALKPEVVYNLENGQEPTPVG